MNINELYEEIQNRFLPEDLDGEFTLEGNCIVWTYNLEENSEEIDAPSYDNDDENLFSFESTSSEELLLEAYDKDYDLLTEFLDEIEEGENWSFSEPNIMENTISFKIF